MRRTWIAALSIGIVTLISGCTSSSTGNLPAASTLLASTGNSARSVSSVHFSIVVHGTVAGVPIQNADGDLTSKGDAKGTAKITLLGQLTQADFVLVNRTFYLKGPTGGYQKFPASLTSQLFDPSAILDPTRGIVKVFTEAQGAQTQGRETMNGTDSYRITGKISKTVVNGLLAGINQDVNATLWVAADSKHLPVKIELTVPGSGGSQAATVDVSFSNFDEPVTITAPTTS